jgi:hypothetical protein
LHTQQYATKILRVSKKGFVPWEKGKESKMKMRSFLMAVMLPLSFAASPVQAADNAEARLYATRLQSVTVPRHIQQEAAKHIGAALSSTYIYVVLSRDGNPYWISPKQKLIPNQTKFEWPDALDSTVTFLWDMETQLIVRVFLADDTTQASATAAGIGLTGGAGLGAVIGGILAGAFTGGLAAPAGALIGAAIGGGSGAVIGGATGALAANDRVLFELDCSAGGSFPLDGNLDHTVTSLGERFTASVAFRLLDAKTPAQQGTLELGEKYVVRLRTIAISSNASVKRQKQLDKAKYYVLFKQGSTKYPFLKKDPITIPTDIAVNPEIYTVLKNTGEPTQVQVYQQNLFFDDPIFTSTIGKTDGKNWVFIGKANPDDVNDASYISFETFGPLK